MPSEEDVVHAYRSAQRTLALAESVTGGLVAARLTRVPGAGGVLQGGVVVYTDEAKRALLGVDPQGRGISRGVTEAIASAVRARLAADVGLGITGAAGPEAPEGVDVGTLHLALATSRGVEHRELRVPGGRDAVRERAVAEALALLLKEAT